MRFRAPGSRTRPRVSARRLRDALVPVALMAVLALATGSFALTGEGTSGTTAVQPAVAALGGGMVPVLVSVPPSAPADGVTFAVALAPGEARKGETVEATAVGEAAGPHRPRLRVEVAARHPDGSAARLTVRADGLGPGEHLVLIRPPRLADPAGLAMAASSPPAQPGGVAVFGGAVASLVRAALWHGDLAREGSSQPPWWAEAAARFPVGTDPADLDGRIAFVEAAYAEKGRPQKAIRLYQEIADQVVSGTAAGSAAADGAVPGADVAPARLRSWLRVCHEIAHLYDGALQDDARSLGWALRCAAAPLADREEERQNRIAAGLAAARAVEGLDRPEAALVLYRLMARDLLLDPDPYGTLLLPQLFLQVADGELAAGRTGAAEAAYRAATAAAGRLPDGTPSNFLAPGSVARAALRRLAAHGLRFSRVADGIYQGQAYGYNAPVGVRLTFEGGRCTELHVTDLGDKRPLDAYRVLPDRILETQSLDVDAVTGATVTSRAIVSAATEAVAEAGGGERAATPSRPGRRTGGGDRRSQR